MCAHASPPEVGWFPAQGVKQSHLVETYRQKEVGQKQRGFQATSSLMLDWSP